MAKTVSKRRSNSRWREIANREARALETPGSANGSFSVPGAFDAVLGRGRVRQSPRYPDLSQSEGDKGDGDDDD